MGQKLDFVCLVATMPGRHSGDQVHKVKKIAAPSFLYFRYRSGQAHLGLEDYGAARDVLRAAKALDPANASVQRALKQAETRLAAENKEQQQVYASMFAS